MSVLNNHWIRVNAGVPKDTENVLITNGKEVWIGDYNPNRKIGDRWAVVYNGAPPFDATEIIAWAYMPDVPQSL